MRSKRAARRLWVILLAVGLASACGCDQQARTAIKTGIKTYVGTGTGVSASFLNDFILSFFTGGLGSLGGGGSHLPSS